MWSIGVTALLVSSVVLTALIAYMDHFGESVQHQLLLDWQESADQVLQTAGKRYGTVLGVYILQCIRCHTFRSIDLDLETAKLQARLPGCLPC